MKMAVVLLLSLIFCATGAAEYRLDNMRLQQVLVQRVDLVDQYVVIDDIIYHIAPRVNFNGREVAARSVLSSLSEGMLLEIKTGVVSGKRLLLDVKVIPQREANEMMRRLL